MTHFEAISQMPPHERFNIAARFLLLVVPGDGGAAQRAFLTAVCPGATDQAMETHAQAAQPSTAPAQGYFLKCLSHSTARYEKRQRFLI